MSRFVITANDLRSGDVVFRDAAGRWTASIDAALVATKDGAEVLLRAAEDDAARHRVLAPYAVEVAVGNGAVVPVHIRERIRCLGPTVRPDLARAASGFSTTSIE